MQRPLSAEAPVSGEASQRLHRELQHLRGPAEQAALLQALLLTPGSSRERQAWVEEHRGLPQHEALLNRAQAWPDAARLPALEWLLLALAPRSLTERQRLLLSTRRMMCADGKIRPLDRLLLLLLRQRLTEQPALRRAPGQASTELAGLPLEQRQAMASLSAYLARLVPQADALSKVGPAGVRWYTRVLHGLWGSSAHAPACLVPDGHELVQGLQAVQALGWQHRPQLARLWSEAALDGAERPDIGACEALRVACQLIDTPLPPALAGRFLGLPPPEPPRPGA